MAEKDEKKTASSKLNSFLEKNRKAVLITSIVVLVLVIAFICVEVIRYTSSRKALAQVEAYYYELVEDSADLDDAGIAKASTECIEKLAPYTKKSGIAGVRANMFSAELAYVQADYETAIAFYEDAIVKGKKAYTTPICLYNKGSCYEELKQLDKAAEAYKAAAEFEDFSMAAHANFSLGRVLEAQGDYKGAAEAYKVVTDNFSDDEWGVLAKTRIIDLKTKGKIE